MGKKGTKNYQRRNCETLKLSAKNVDLVLRRRFSLKIGIPNNFEKENLYSEKEYWETKALENHNINSKTSIFEENKLKWFQYPDEFIYKSFPALYGILKGELQQVLVILSTHAIYISSSLVLDGKLISKIFYEDVDILYFGAFERWLSITMKDFCLENREKYSIQIEVFDPKVMLNLIAYFELAIRRRIQILLLKERHCFNLPSTSKYHSTHIQSKMLSDRINLSIGRCIDIFIPCVVSTYQEEIKYIEKYLLKCYLLKTDIDHIIHCWLVFWENGSVAVSDEEQIRPTMEGHLMINIPSLHTWSPGYFILRGGIFYHFLEPSDRLPHTLIDLRTCCGCSRIASSIRPHGFQIMRENDSPILLAAPNDSTASQWLQNILTVLCSKMEFKENRRFVPCQLIQTTCSLVLTHQCDIFQWNDSSTNKNITNLTDSETIYKFPSHIPSKNDTPKMFDNDNITYNKNPIVKNVNENLGNNSEEKEINKNEQIKDYFCDNEVCKPEICCKNLDNYEQTNSGSIDSTFKCDLKDKYDLVDNISCPLTPPPLEFPTLDQETEDEVQNNNSKSPIEVLSSAYYEQISEMIVERNSKAVFVEFECTEANELAFDWALYFFSDSNLDDFLANIRERSDDNKVVITSCSTGDIAKFLQDGSASVLN